MTALNVIIKWLKGSSVKVNNSKKEMCIFHTNSSQVIKIMTDGILMKTRDSVNVLGVEFDLKLQLSNHIGKAMKKVLQTITEIRMIKKYFSKKQN
jgi:hypothetical protein